MKTVYVLGCCKSKLLDAGDIPAKERYTGEYFKRSMVYGTSRGATEDDFIILSAKYGLIDLNYKIPYYDLTLNDMKVNELKIWSDDVYQKMLELYDIENTHFVFLCGIKYRRFLIPRLPHTSVPTEGLQYGYSLQWFDSQISGKTRIQGKEYIL